MFNYFHLVVLKSLYDNITRSAKPLKPVAPYTSCNGDIKVVDFELASNVVVTSADLCPICKASCVSEPTKYEEVSIECSSCKCWFHLQCTDLRCDDERVTKSSANWFCQTCVEM